MIMMFPNISPGLGGNGSTKYGGGGGGVLVDGIGPTGGDVRQGEGYGAGGGYDDAYPGVIILEFK